MSEHSVGGGTTMTFPFNGVDGFTHDGRRLRGVGHLYRCAGPARTLLKDFIQSNNVTGFMGLLSGAKSVGRAYMSVPTGACANGDVVWVRACALPVTSSKHLKQSETDKGSTVVAHTWNCSSRSTCRRNCQRVVRVGEQVVTRLYCAPPANSTNAD